MQNQTVVAAAEEAVLLLAGPNEPKKYEDEVKFIYMRLHYYDKSIASPPRATILSPKGGVTIAYTRNNEHIVYYFAKCNPIDTFSKRIGRAVATGRLLGGFGEMLEVESKATRSQVTTALILAYYEHEATWMPSVEQFIY